MFRKPLVRLLKNQAGMSIGEKIAITLINPNKGE